MLIFLLMLNLAHADPCSSAYEASSALKSSRSNEALQVQKARAGLKKLPPAKGDYDDYKECDKAYRNFMEILIESSVPGVGKDIKFYLLKNKIPTLLTVRVDTVFLKKALKNGKLDLPGNGSDQLDALYQKIKDEVAFAKKTYRDLGSEKAHKTELKTAKDNFTELRALVKDAEPRILADPAA